MKNNEQPFIPADYKDAQNYAAERLQSTSEGYAPTEGLLVAPQEINDFFFALQGEVEKRGHMDYTAYTTDLWQRLVDPQDKNSEAFKHFQGTLISSLHNIDMSEMIQPEIQSSMPDLVGQYSEIIRGVSVWSTGDVTATGYQLAKIESSGLRKAFFGAFTTRAAGAEYARKNTSYLVHDDKFNGLVDYVDSKMESDSDRPIKIVVIEDSVKNFKKAQDALNEKFGEGTVEVTPIWFTSSREGKKAIAEAEEGGEEAKKALQEKLIELNAISSFEDLLDAEKFGQLLADSYIMLDFDGVVGDNIAMRVEQSRVTFNALLEGARMHTHMTDEEITQHFKQMLQQIS
ncbi:hypothetical protein EBZ57_03530 [bacterium]|nr:hypothetical protein [bacterium]